MAEAIGIGASIVTFIALASQVFHGCQLLSEFLDDVVDASDDVRYLHAEIRGLRFAIHGFQSVLQQFEPSMNVRAVEDQIRDALVSSGLAITGTRTFVEEYMCRRKWKKNLLMAGKKGRVEKHVDRLGKAKSDISLAQGSAILILNIAHRSRLEHLSQLILELGSSMTVKPQTTTSNHSLLHAQRLGLNTQADSFTMRTGSIGRSETLSGRPEAVPIKIMEPPHHVQSMILGDGIGGLPNEQTCYTADRKPVLKTDLEEFSCIRCEQRSIHNVRHTQTIRLRFITIVIHTIYTQNQKSSELSNDYNTTARKARKTYTTETILDIRPRSWLFQCGLSINFRKPCFDASRLDTDMRFRVYNLVHWDSPISKACRIGKVAAVHSLFIQGRASPYDFVLGKSSKAKIISLVDIVMDRWLNLGLRLSNRKSSVRIAQSSLNKLGQLLKMCQFLTEHGRAPTGPVRWQEETFSRIKELLHRRWSSHPELSPYISAITNFILSEEADYPLGTKIYHYHDTPSQLEPVLQEWTEEHEAYIICPNELLVGRRDHKLNIMRYMKKVGAHMSGMNSLILDPDAVYLRKMLSIISPNYKVAFLTSICVGAERQAHAMSKSGMGSWDHAIRSRLIECLKAGMDVQAVTYHYGAYSSLIQHFISVGKEELLRSALLETGLEAAEISAFFKEQACASGFQDQSETDPICHFSKFMNLYSNTAITF